jgi:hypothetical protein
MLIIVYKFTILITQKFLISFNLLNFKENIESTKNIQDNSFENNNINPRLENNTALNNDDFVDVLHTAFFPN